MEEFKPTTVNDKLEAAQQRTKDAERTKAWLGFDPDKQATLGPVQAKKVNQMAEYLNSRPDEGEVDTNDHEESPMEGEYQPTSDIDIELAYLETEFKNVESAEDKFVALDLLSDFCDSHGFSREQEKAIRTSLLQESMHSTEPITVSEGTPEVEPAGDIDTEKADDESATPESKPAKSEIIKESDLKVGDRVKVKITHTDAEPFFEKGTVTKITAGVRGPILKSEDGIVKDVILGEKNSVYTVKLDNGEVVEVSKDADDDIVNIEEAAAESESVTEPEAPADPETAAESEPVTEPEAPADPETATEPEAPADPETATEPEAPKDVKWWDKVKQAPTAAYVATLAWVTSTKEKYNELPPKRKNTVKFVGGVAAGAAAGALILGTVWLASKGIDTNSNDVTEAGNSAAGEIPNTGDSTGDTVQTVSGGVDVGGADVSGGGGAAVEYPASARIISPGEGLYKTFEQMGLDLTDSQRNELLDEVGPKLQKMGVTYRDTSPTIGGWGLNAIGKMPQKALDIINNEAIKLGFTN